MKKEQLKHAVRKTRIYKGIYRPSSNLSRFLTTLLSILLQGQSPAGGSFTDRRRRG
ncbi:MAG TPA: hypothetical protein VGQ51_08540 [Puia sp.]|nr:hypothetical protein [Puia sp.]